MNNKNKGILCIILSAFSFALMSFFVKLSGDLPSLQKSFFRNFISLLVAYFILKKSGFHSSPNPMYILNHYQPYKGAKFALVDIRGTILDYKEIYISSEIELIKEMTFEEMVQYWLDKNPDLSQIDLENQTFIDIAKKHNLKTVLNMLIEKGSK